jgi:hypothetical protein
MLPGLKGGLLPAGIHEAELGEVADAMAGTPWREWLLEGLRLVLTDLAAAGCATAYLDGSFVTDKHTPGDYDLCWDRAGVDRRLLHPVIEMVAPPRTEQKRRYRGDILPNVFESSTGLLFVDFFQVHKETGAAKGIVQLDPRTVTP